MEPAQVAIANAAVAGFGLSADVLASDTTNSDSHTQTPGELARRGQAKSKRGDLRVVGLGLRVSEKGHVPLLSQTYPDNGSDQAVLAACLQGLAQLKALDSAEGRERPAQRTVVRDGGFWSRNSNSIWRPPPATASSHCRWDTRPRKKRCRWWRNAAR